MWKYRDAHAYRVLHLDAGHLGQTFHLAATALGLAPFTTAATRNLMVEKALGLDGVSEIVLYAARVFPKIAASTLTLIVLCGGLAWLLHVSVGTDPLTAYLATSPGGADSVAIIAASSKVDLPFVMAMQTARFILVLLVGPTLARAVARWTGT